MHREKFSGMLEKNILPASAAQRGGRRMETVAVILTGGRSSRMGRDKCALRLGGETFLERLVER